ncbi:MAG: (2Fe-2S)-binding protein [Vampirovibrionia bacterium]
MKKQITFKINGRNETLNVDCNKTLLKMIREDLYLTGTKEGCAEGECGACTIIVDGVAVNSCLMLAPEADGKEIITIEGLSENGELCDLQKMFIEHHAFQCGFCTPGMIMSAKALLDKNPEPTREEVKEAIAGNLCRCTGYQQIIEAIEATSKLIKTK